MSQRPTDGDYRQWDQFWAAGPTSQSREAIRLPALAALWPSLLGHVELSGDTSITLELAAGTGSLSAYLSALPSLSKATRVALDASFQALRQLQGGEHGVVGELTQLPLADRSVDLLTSQFGVEYAGLSSLCPALKCVARRGFFAFVMHIKGGVIYRECGTNLDAISRFTGAPFLARAAALLESIWSDAPRSHQESCAVSFRASLIDVETLLMELKDSQGRDTVLQTYNSVADMIQKPMLFDPAEARTWFSDVDAELWGYGKRMKHMQSAALSGAEFEAFCDDVHRAGFTIIQRGVFNDSKPMHEAPSLAFYIVGQRRQ